MSGRIEKTQTIEQAKEGESRGVERVGLYEDKNSPSTGEKTFKGTLEERGIKNIATQTIIKRAGEDYIFFMNDNSNKPLFVIEKGLVEKYIQYFYQDQKNTEDQETQEATWVRLNDVKEGQTIDYIKGELKDLKKDVEKNLEYEDVPTIKRKTDRLITFFEQEEKLSKEKSSWIFGKEYKRDKGLRNIQKKEIKNRINELKDIKTHIEWLEKNKDQKYTTKRDNGNGKTEVKMDDINDYDTKMTLRQFSAKIEELGKEAPEFILQRNRIIEGTAAIPSRYGISINTPEDAKLLQNILKKENGEYEILNKLNLETAKQKELNEDFKMFDKYLTAVIQNPDGFRPTELEFKTTHTEEFKQLCEMDPTLKKYYTSANTHKNSQGGGIDSQDQTGNQYNITNETENGTNNNKREVQNNDIIDPSYTGYKDAIEQHGVRGAIYKTFDYFPNMKTEQKSFWTNALFLGGMGFVLWKAGKRLFTGAKNAKGEKVGPGLWGRLAIIGGVTLGTNMLTGKSPIEFIDKAVNGGFKFNDIKLKFWEKSGEASEDAKKVIVNPLTATFLVGNQKISELTNTLDPKTFDFKNYELLLNTAIATGSTDKQKLLESIGKDKNIMRTGLAQMGVTPENIGQLDQNMTVDEYYARYMENMQTAENYRIKNKLNIVKGKENDYQKLITSGKELTEADLEKANHEGVFEAANTVDSEEIKKAKAVLYKQVDDLTNITTDKESIKIGVGEFYETMPQDTNGNKILNIVQQGDKTYVETYGQKTVIDFNKKILKGFSDTTGNEYVFPGYAELIAAANLTNRLRQIFQDNTAQSAEPFHIDKATGNIEFDNTKRYEVWRKETTAASGGWFTNKLEKISHTLENHRAEYCKYLNTQKFRKTAPAQ